MKSEWATINNTAIESDYDTKKSSKEIFNRDILSTRVLIAEMVSSSKVLKPKKEKTE